MRVLLRVLPSASTQTYSARIVSSGYGRELYRSMTAGSKLDFPVVFPRTPDMCNADDLPWESAGANADDWLAQMRRTREDANFMVDS